MKVKNEGTTLYLDLLKKTLTASIYDESAWTIKEGKKSLIKKWFYSLLRKHNLLVIKSNCFDAEKRLEGRDWPLFGYSMAGLKRLDNIQSCVEDVLRNNIVGDFIETGWQRKFFSVKVASDFSEDGSLCGFGFFC